MECKKFSYLAKPSNSFFTSWEICMLVAEQRYFSCKKTCNMFIMYLTGPNLHYHFRNVKFHQKLDI